MSSGTGCGPGLGSGCGERRGRLLVPGELPDCCPVVARAVAGVTAREVTQYFHRCLRYRRADGKIWGNAAIAVFTPTTKAPLKMSYRITYRDDRGHGWSRLVPACEPLSAELIELEALGCVVISIEVEA